METSGISSSVARVTVYAEGARVTRIARVPRAAGDVTLVGLPLALDDGSVRVRARGAIARGVRITLDAPGAHDDLPPPDDAALDAATVRATAADAEAERIERALGDLELLAPPPRAEPDEGPRPDWSAALAARLALVELRGTREASLRAELARAIQAADDAHRALAVARDRAARASTARGARPHELRKAIRVALVDVDVASDDVVELEVEYLVPGARWAPTYVARLGGDRLRLELRAVVAQRTGEDWRGVTLSLSTAQAQRFTELPELPVAKIGRRQPPPPRTGWRAAPIGVDALFADWDRSFAGRVARVAAPPPEPEPAALLDADDDRDFARRQRITGQHAAIFGGTQGPPMPPPPAPMPVMAPMLMPASMPMSRSKGASPLRALGAIGGAAAGAVGALAGVARGGGGRARAESVAKTMSFAAPNDRDGAALDEPLDGELAAPADLLAFGELMLPGPRSLVRGKLIRISRRERYLRTDVDVDVDVVALLDGAQREARAIAPAPPAVRTGWDTSYDYALRADGAVDVPSDGAWYGLALTAAEAPATVRHVVVPRETTDVFRVAELTSPLDAPMLPGPMDVYDGKDFVLTTQVDWVPPRGAMVLGLGVDATVKVTRNADFREEAAGMLRGSLRLEHAVRLTAENLGRRTIALEIRERVPVAPLAGGDDDVEVTVEQATPAWEPWLPEPRGPDTPILRGGHRWRVGVGVGERLELQARYLVKIAGKHELIGGNRREP